MHMPHPQGGWEKAGGAQNKSGAVAPMAIVQELRQTLMTLPVRQALISQAIFSPGER